MAISHQPTDSESQKRFKAVLLFFYCLECIKCGKEISNDYLLEFDNLQLKQANTLKILLLANVIEKGYGNDVLQNAFDTFIEDDKRSCSKKALKNAIRVHTNTRLEKFFDNF